MSSRGYQRYNANYVMPGNFEHNVNVTNGFMIASVAIEGNKISSCRCEPVLRLYFRCSFVMIFFIMFSYPITCGL